MLSALKRKRIPLNQNECTADFRIGVPFEQNLQDAFRAIVHKENLPSRHLCERLGFQLSGSFAEVEKDFVEYRLG